MLVLGRFVGVRFAVMVLVASGAFGEQTASAQAVLPTPTHLVVGPSIEIPSELHLSNSTGSPTLVTPSQARGITMSMWQLWEEALISRNTTALTQLSPPGQLQRGELYNCAWPTGGCVDETSPRPVNNVTVIVPVQRSYRIDFLAEISTIQNISNDVNAAPQWVPWVELQVLTKADASAPWQLSFDTGYDGTNHQQPPLLPFELAPEPASSSSSQSDSYNMPPANSSSVPAPTFLSLLAQYYQSFKDTGNPPANDRFAVDGAADGYGSQLAVSRQDNIDLGSRNQYDFSADPSAGEWEFSGPGGLPIECGTVLDTSTNSPVGGPVLFQNADRTNWGMALAPGTYSKIVTTTTHPTCVYDVDGVLDAAGDSGYSTGVTGPSGSEFSTALVVGLGLGVLGVVVIMGVIVGVAVFVTRRRHVAGPTVAFVDSPYSRPGAPPGYSPGMPPPPPSSRPPPPPPGTGPPRPWPSPHGSTRVRTELPTSGASRSERDEGPATPDLVEPGRPSRRDDSYWSRQRRSDG